MKAVRKLQSYCRRAKDKRKIDFSDIKAVVDSERYYHLHAARKFIEARQANPIDLGHVKDFLKGGIYLDVNTCQPGRPIASITLRKWPWPS